MKLIFIAVVFFSANLFAQTIRCSLMAIKGPDPIVMLMTDITAGDGFKVVAEDADEPNSPGAIIRMKMLDPQDFPNHFELDIHFIDDVSKVPTRTYTNYGGVGGIVDSRSEVFALAGGAADYEFLVVCKQ